jgi:hypothetical protein
MPGNDSNVQTLYGLNAEMLGLARTYDGWDISNVGELIAEFQKRFSVVRQLHWKYLTDENFAILAQSNPNAQTFNRLFLSHLIRLAEAYQWMSVWRVTEVAAPAVRALNANEITAACVLTRSLLELTASFALAAPQIGKWFRTLPWERVDEASFVSSEMELFITKLVFGSRLRDGDDPLKQTNILTLINKLDKLAVQLGHQPQMVAERYAVLSEAAHPNHLGFERFMGVTNHDAATGWSTRELRVAEIGAARDHLAKDCLWALAFSHFMMLESVSKIDEAKTAYFDALGRPLP